MFTTFDPRDRFLVCVHWLSSYPLGLLTQLCATLFWWKDSGGFKGLGRLRGVLTSLDGWNILLNVVCALLYVVGGVCGVTLQFVTFLPPHTSRNTVRWRLKSRFVVRAGDAA